MSITKAKKAVREQRNVIEQMESRLAEIDARLDEINHELPDLTIAYYRASGEAEAGTELSEVQDEKRGLASEKARLEQAIQNANVELVGLETKLFEANRANAEKRASKLQAEIADDVQAVVEKSLPELFGEIVSINDKYAKLSEIMTESKMRSPGYKRLVGYEIGSMLEGFKRVISSNGHMKFRLEAGAITRQTIDRARELMEVE